MARKHKHYKSRGNGTGGVTECKGRKKPYRVRITAGYKFDESTGKAKQVTQDLGYFATRAEAEAKLAEYLKSPYDLANKDITLKEVYDLWSKEYFRGIKSSSIRSVTSAFAYCSSLYNMRIRDIRNYHLAGCMNDGYIIPDRGKDKGKKRYATPNTKERMKSVFNMLFDYAMDRELVQRNYARSFNIPENIKQAADEQKKVKRAFSYDDLQSIWNAVGEIEFADMVIVNIYTGFRPAELAKLRVENVNLDEGYMRGGGKTKSGTNRVVPIHPVIRHLVEEQYHRALKVGSETLYFDLNSQTGKCMTYDKYRLRFVKVLKKLGIADKYTAHCCRVTFTTLAKAYKVDDNIIDRIVGHASTNITENTYTRRVLAQLQEEMEKIPADIDPKYLDEAQFLD